VPLPYSPPHNFIVMILVSCKVPVQSGSPPQQ
jgi:hypothetical protein